MVSIAKSNIIIILSLLIFLQGYSTPLFAQGEVSGMSVAHKVLGRDLTEHEVDSLGSHYDENTIKLQFLHREHNLVTVRALSSVGVIPTKDLITELYFENDKTYTELKEYLFDLKEKYGSVEKGLEHRNLTKDKDAIFQHAVAAAFKEVYCLTVEEAYPSAANRSQLYSYLRSKEAIHHSEIKRVLIDNLDREDKIAIYNRVVTKADMAYLKKKDKFRKTIIDQEFTCDSFYEVLKQLSKK